MGQYLSYAAKLSSLNISSEAQIDLKTDAPEIVIRVILQKIVNGETQPLSSFSRNLTPTETRYSTFGRELLANYSAIRHFCHILETRQVTIFTDHKPLVYACQVSADHHSPKEI